VPLRARGTVETVGAALLRPRYLPFALCRLPGSLTGDRAAQVKRTVYTVLAFQVLAFISLWVGGKPLSAVALVLVGCSTGLTARVAFDMRRDHASIGGR
jgi:hypothetical protein